MKRTILFVLAAFPLVGCLKQAELPIESDSAVTLNVSLTTDVLKSIATDDEMALEDVQFFVFDDTDALEAYSKVLGDSVEASLRCTPGQKKVVAVANGPEMGFVASYQELCGLKSDLLEDNSQEYLLMTGQDTYEVIAGKQSQSMQLAIRRRVAKIVLNSLTVDFELEHNKNEEFIVRGVYLVNVAGGSYYLNDAESWKWYNQGMLQSSDDVSLFSNVISRPQILENGQTLDEKFELYAYPNACGDASGLPWSPRCTRLVVEAAIGLEVCYYPVTIPQLQANCVYKVNLVVRHVGSKSPDEPVEILAMGGSVIVEDWAKSEDIYEEI